MKRMKYLILMVTFLVSSFANLFAQSVLIEISPNEPKVDKEIRVITHVNFFTASEYIHHQTTWLDDFNIHVDLYYFQGMQQMTSYHKDSVALGELPVGTYTIIADLKVNNDFGDLGDWNDYWIEDSDTIIFRVNETLNAISNDEEKINLLFHPNPANHQLIVKASTKQMFTQLQILDDIGRIVLTQDKISYSLNEITIDTSSLDSGTYTLILKNKDKMISKKFVKN